MNKIQTNKNPSKITTDILDFSKVDGRYLNRTNRTVHFATKVTPEFDYTIRRLAHEQQCLITQMLEKYMSAYFELEELKQAKENEEKEIAKVLNKANKTVKIKVKK